MNNWTTFAEAAPEIAQAGVRLLNLNEVAFLATVSASGRPRLHPFVPRIVDGALVAFVLDSSPKIVDLRVRRQYAIHLLPGDEDEEVFISGEAVERDHLDVFRERAADAMGFATGVDAHHILFEFLFDRALHTRWLDFGTKNHRPVRQVWRFDVSGLENR
jgi:hypothetical protein